MSAIALRWLAGLLVSLTMLAGAYWAGDHNRNNAWLAKQAIAERAANKKYAAEVERGDAAAGEFIVEHQAMQSDFQNLTEKFNELSKRIPLVVAVGGNACSAGSGRLWPGLPAQPEVRPDAPAGNALAGDAGPYLSAGALWMWNSALAGTDQPAGACSAADTSTAACAVATEATVDDAWANHRTNAQICAEDRLVHQRLIDFLQTRKQP